MKKRVLVIGSEGNVGTRLVPYLISQGHIVYCCDIKQDYRDNYIISDINNPIDLYNEMKGFKPEIVIHLAAMVSRITCEKSSSLAVISNLGGLNNIINLCRFFNSKLIYFSTSEIYGNIGGILTEDRTDIEPNNRYGLTKYLGEKLVEYEVKMNGLEAVSVRPFMFYDENETFGDNRSAMIRFIKSAFTNTPIDVHIGSKRSWLHMNDAVILIERTFYLDKYEILNLSNDEIIDTEDMARMISEKIDADFDTIFNRVEQPDKMTLEKIPSSEKMIRLLGHIPEIKLNEGLDLVIDKVRKRLDLGKD